MSNANEPMLDMYIFETTQLINKLEELLIDSEEEGTLENAMDEIFRIMHTIKGNSMMMMFDAIGNLAHSVEDLFDYLRQYPKTNYKVDEMIDIVLQVIDFFKNEVDKIEDGEEADGDSQELIKEIREKLDSIKFFNPTDDNKNNVSEDKSQESDSPEMYYVSSKKTVESEDGVSYYMIHIVFDSESGMENVRAFSVVHNLKEIADKIIYFPKELIQDDTTAEIINENGFDCFFQSMLHESEVNEWFKTTAFISSISIDKIDKKEFVEHERKFSGIDAKQEKIDVEPSVAKESKTNSSKESTVSKTVRKKKSKKQKYISIEVEKIDRMMNLIGELVVSESMVTNNKDLKNITLENFEKASRQHRIIINDIQDLVMSLRMVPLTLTFQKMKRIVRDMNKKVNKSVELELVGEETEVDKNIIENLGDPLMHIIRNSMDHGIESPDERQKSGKVPDGKIILEAKNSGSDVLIIIKDDGRGLDKEQIMKKAISKEILTKDPSEYSDQEIYELLFAPGFSTKEKVTEFSGRGVGLDVVKKNIEKLGGRIYINSEVGIGTEFKIKIPLTLSILDGMLMRVGMSRFSIPITAIKESFEAKNYKVIKDPNDNEMVIIRQKAYPILRLYERYNIETQCKKLEDGILIMIEYDGKTMILFVDELIGEQQVVVKSLSKFMKSIDGIAGCALLGDGNISLIIDPGGIII